MVMPSITTLFPRSRYIPLIELELQSPPSIRMLLKATGAALEMVATYMPWRLPVTSQSKMLRSLIAAAVPARTPTLLPWIRLFVIVSLSVPLLTSTPALQFSRLPTASIEILSAAVTIPWLNPMMSIEDMMAAFAVMCTPFPEHAVDGCTVVVIPWPTSSIRLFNARFWMKEPSSTFTLSSVLAASIPRWMLPLFCVTNNSPAFTRTRPSALSSSLCVILSSIAKLSSFAADDPSRPSKDTSVASMFEVGRSIELLTCEM